MAYEDTGVPVSRSQEQIRKLLIGHGCTAVQFVSQPPQEGFGALVPIENATYTIRIEATCKPRKDRRAIEQEERRVWRVLFYHMKAIFEASDSGVMEFRRMVLPYIVTKSGFTIGEAILPQLDKAVQTGPTKLLGSGQ